MTGIGYRYIACSGVQQTADHGDKHAMNRCLAQFPVDGCQQYIGFVYGFSQAAEQAGRF